RFVLGHPDADQIAGEIVTLRQRMQRLACNVFLSDLTLEFDAVGVVLGHGFHPWKARRPRSIPNPRPVHRQGRTPVAANYLPGEPVWLGLGAPPSSAKTELPNSGSHLPNVEPIATLTVAALLSGTPKNERDKGAKGGLLRSIGEFGIAVLKDFGSVLSMHTETRAEVLAAMREIFDGKWTRHLGTDGGRTLHWEGKLGLVFGSTPAIDAYHAVIGSLGDRWLLSRMAPVAGKQQFTRALKHGGAAVAQMRKELAEAVAALFAGRRAEPRPVTDEEANRIGDAISLAVRLRGTI